MKRKIKLIRGDTANVEVIILYHQQEGKFIYRPEIDDDILMTVYDLNGQIALVIRAITADYKYVYFDIDTSDIKPGLYHFDVTIRMSMDNTSYHVCKSREIEIV